MSDNRGPQLAAITGTLGGLACIATILRCYTRAHVVRAFGLDDHFAVAALLAHIWYTAVVLLGISFGTGQHMENIPINNAKHALRYWWMCYISYCATMTLAKISIGLFFLRLMVQPVQRGIIWTAMIINAVTGVVFMLATMLQCRPISYFWTKVYSDARGICLDMDIIIDITYLYGATCAACDIVLGLLPIIVVWKLESLDVRTKLLLLPILCMACTASVAAIIRMPYIEDFRNPDFLYGTVDIAIWSTTEAGLAVVAASLATLRPLVRHVAGCFGSGSCDNVHEMPHLRPHRASPSDIFRSTVRATSEKEEEIHIELCSPKAQTFVSSDAESSKSQTSPTERLSGHESWDLRTVPQAQKPKSRNFSMPGRHSMNWPSRS